MPGLATHLLERLSSQGDRPLLHGNAHCRREVWTAADIVAEVRRTAAGLVALGVAPGSRVGLVADNHDLWIVADLAVLLVGAVDVPRAADASTEEIAFVLEHSGCETVLVEDPRLFGRLRADLERLGLLERTVILKPEPGRHAEALDLSALQERGAAVSAAELEARAAAVEEGDVATIVYTSGTTGNPKGVTLTHGNLLHNARVLPDLVAFSSRDSYLSFLPTWHAFERTVEYCALSAGMAIHYSSKAAVRKDLRRVRPTIVAGVPRLWESLAAAIETGVAKSRAPLRWIVRVLLAGSATWGRADRRLRGLELDEDRRVARPEGLSRLGLAALRLATLPLHSLASALVFRKLREAAGGRIRFFISGGGALPRHVDELVNRAGILLLNGYGLTETAPVVSVRLPGINILETSGRPLPDTAFEVRDEAGRPLPPGERGVLWIRGPQVMQGYWRNPEASDRVLRDGWFDSGDLAYVSDLEDVVICGRAKDTIVLRGGENVEPEAIEARVLESPLVRDVVLVGHTHKHLAALIVPEPAALSGLVPGLDPDDVAAAAGSAEAARLIKDDLDRRISPARGFRVFERIPRIALLRRPFEVEDGTLTATMKKRRGAIEAMYEAEIEAMFAEGSPETIPADSGRS